MIGMIWDMAPITFALRISIPNTSTRADASERDQRRLFYCVRNDVSRLAVAILISIDNA